MMCNSFFFFFSSRRRHTRYWRDWSSDVCSSDLEPVLHLIAEGVDLFVGSELRHPGIKVDAQIRVGDVIRRDQALGPDVQRRPPILRDAVAAGGRQSSLQQMLVETDTDELHVAGLF